MAFQYLNINKNASIILSLAVILFCGFLLTRLTSKLKLPYVTGYIIAGILIGPHVLNLIPETIIDGMDFVTDIALAFIAFEVGRYLKFSSLKKNGSQVIIITICEALIAAVVITMSMIFIFKLPVSFSLLLGAIGSATAPASTMMTIKQYKAKGDFVNLIVQVVALDDAVSLIAFSMCAAVVQVLNAGASLNVFVFLMPTLFNIIAIIVGIIFGLILNKLISSRRSEFNRLILAIAMILALTGFCSLIDISPLLSCMALGTAFIDLSNDKELFRQINSFSPPVLTIFFVLSGMRLDVSSLISAGLIGVSYFAIRILGKYIGAFIGAVLSNSSMEVRKYFGMTLIPQAGVSIGLAMLGHRMLPPEIGSLLLTIILSSGVLYEMIGPGMVKLALHLSKSIK
ncbi:MAG: cation:proton antiporter [Firmicutes bacterium]|nr:cation:proton antiporter [Bacillota bacterium]